MLQKIKAFLAIIRAHPAWVICFILLIGAAVRIWMFNVIPTGLNQDEASIGYDAYSLLKYGVDRNGVTLPVQFISWGSGQNALYAYLSMPFIWIFGLSSFSIRLVNLLFGLAALPIFFLLVRKLSGLKVAAVALFMLAINPWHIMMSRWGLESNLLPSILLIAVFVLVCSFERPKLIILAGFLAALCLYAYGTAYLFIPVFCVAVYPYLVYHKKIKIAPSLAAIALFAVTALPIGLFLVVNWFKTGTIHLGILTVPELTGSARFFAIVSTDFLQRVTDLSMFLITQYDNMPSNVISGFGYVYLISMPLLIVGLWPSSANTRVKGFKPDTLMFVWLLIALTMALFTHINVNRLNILYFPMIYFIAKGVIRLSERGRWFMPAVISAYAVYFSLFCWTYFGKYKIDTEFFFNNSLGAAIKYADSIPGRTIYIEEKYINMPYIQVLFNTKYPSPDFISTVVFKNPGDEFQEAASFGRYRFGFNADMPPDMNAVYIMNYDDASHFDKNSFTDVPFRLYHVLVPK